MAIRLYVALLAFLGLYGTAWPQNRGGTLRVHLFDSPPSISMHEESTLAAQAPAMGIFNNLVIYDQAVERAGPGSIVPDLATAWEWNADRTSLTFILRGGVRWHDGTPFTAKDVKCTWDLLLGRSAEPLRQNPRRAWYRNITDVVIDDSFRVTFRLQRPQPALMALLASGFSAIYPCHVSPAQMRQHPIGTGPFRFVEFKRNDSIRVTRNHDYWKSDRPYLDGIDWQIIRNRSTGILAFQAKSVDMTSPYFLTGPVVADIRAQSPLAKCEVVPSNVQRNIIVNRHAPPFDNAGLRKAVALVIDRKAFIDALAPGTGQVGGALLPPPEGSWGLPEPEMQKLPGYDPDVAKNRAEARRIMEGLGYGAAAKLKIQVLTRDSPIYRDPAIMLIDQLKEAYIDAELEVVDTPGWYSKVVRHDFTIGLNLTGNVIDDPDQAYSEHYRCGAESNYDRYCNTEVDELIDTQSMEADRMRRKIIVSEIERRLARDVARPVLYFVSGSPLAR